MKQGHLKPQATFSSVPFSCHKVEMKQLRVVPKQTGGFRYKLNAKGVSRKAELRSRLLTRAAPVPSLKAEVSAF